MTSGGSGSINDVRNRTSMRFTRSFVSAFQIVSFAEANIDANAVPWTAAGAVGRTMFLFRTSAVQWPGCFEVSRMQHHWSAHRDHGATQ